jgi:uncharacterized membrane protein YdjX (TVP38/TMEM64 family)
MSSADSAYEPTEPQRSETSRRRIVARFGVGASWIALVVVWELWRRSQNLGYADAAQRAIDAAQHHWWAALAFVLVYLARPLILFPASILTVCGGLLFGPVSGIALTVVAANASAMVAYGIGRWLRSKPVAHGAAKASHTPGPANIPNTILVVEDNNNNNNGNDNGNDNETQATRSFAARWGTRLRAQEFETVLLLRLLGIPFDVVNVGCGILHINPKRFLLATIIGSLPATVAFVLLGAALDRVDQGFGIDKGTLVLSVALIAGSIGVSQIVKRRSKARAA